MCVLSVFDSHTQIDSTADSRAHMCASIIPSEAIVWQAISNINKTSLDVNVVARPSVVWQAISKVQITYDVS